MQAAFSSTFVGFVILLQLIQPITSLQTEVSGARLSLDSAPQESRKLPLHRGTVDLPALRLDEVAEPFNLTENILPIAFFENGTEPPPSVVVGVKTNGQTDIAAILLSLGFCAAGSLFVFACFCLLRNLNPVVYHRLVVSENKEPVEDVSTSVAQARSVGLFDWIAKVYNTTPEEEVARAGLDGWAFLELLRLNTRILVWIGPVVLLTVGCANWQASENMPGLNPLSRLDVGSMSPGSTHLLWVHAASVWLVIIISGWHVVSAHEDFTERRFEWLKAIPRPRATTVLVKNIPEIYRSDKALRDYFVALFTEGVVERAYVVRKTGSLPKQVERLEDGRYTLALARKRWEQSGCPGPEERYGAQLEVCQRRRDQLAEQVVVSQAKIEEAVARRDPIVCSSSGFVTFTTELAQRLASREQYRRDVTEFVLDMPPDPSDVIWGSLTEGGVRRTTWDLVSWFCLLLLFVFWSPLVVIISGWTTLSSINEYAPFVGRFIQEHPRAQPLITGFLSTASLKLFMALLPMILLSIITRFKNLKAGAYAQLHLQSWYATFLVLFVLLVTTLGQGFTSTIAIIARQPSRIVELMASSLPYASHFYFNYIVLGYLTLALEMMRASNLIQYWFYRHFYSFQPEEAKQYSEPEDQASYGIGTRSALQVLMTAITFTFCSCSPLVVVFALPYFCLGQMVYGYLIVFAESKKPDLGGEMWIQTMGQLFSVLLLYVLLMVGVLLAKLNGDWLGPPSAAASAILPLYWTWFRVNSLAYESLPLEEVVKASQAKKEGVHQNEGKYVQPECDPDVTVEDWREGS